MRNLWWQQWFRDYAIHFETFWERNLKKCYDWNLETLLAVARHDNGYTSLEHHTSLNSLQKPDAIETSQPRVVRDRPGGLRSVLRPWTAFMIFATYKKRYYIQLNDFVDTNFIMLDAPEKYEVPTVWLRIPFFDFIASTRAVLHLQLSTLPERSTTIVNAEGNATWDVEALDNNAVKTSVYCKPRSSLGVSAAVINKNDCRAWKRVETFLWRKRMCSAARLVKVPLLQTQKSRTKMISWTSIWMVQRTRSLIPILKHSR